MSPRHEVIRVYNKSRFNIVSLKRFSGNPVDTSRQSQIWKTRACKPETVKPKKKSTVRQLSRHPDGSETTSVKHWRIWLPFYQMNMFSFDAWHGCLLKGTGGRKEGARWMLLTVLQVVHRAYKSSQNGSSLHPFCFFLCVFELTCKSPHQDVISQPWVLPCNPSVFRSALQPELCFQV